MGTRSRAGTWAKATVRALGPGVGQGAGLDAAICGVGQGAGLDAAICGVSRLGDDRIDLGLLCLVALPWESGRARARVRVRGCARARARARVRGCAGARVRGCARGRGCAGARAGARAGVSAEVRGGGRTLGSVNAARKQRKSSPVVPRRRLASASAHLKVAAAVVYRVQYHFYDGYYFLRLVRARVRMSLPLTQLEP